MRKLNSDLRALQKLFFWGMVVIPLINSCAMEKRVYMPGYHVEYEKKWQKFHKHESAELIKKDTKGQKQSEGDLKNDYIKSGNENKDLQADEKMIASIRNKGIDLIPEKINNVFSFPGHLTAKSSKPAAVNAPQSITTKQPGYTPLVYTDRDYGKMAKTGFFLGLNGLLASGPMAFLVSWALCVAGIVLCSIVLKKRIFETLTRRQKNYAIAGLVLSTIGFIICAFWISLIIAA